jgi:hypothetical protein
MVELRNTTAEGDGEERGLVGASREFNREVSFSVLFRAPTIFKIGAKVPCFSRRAALRIV